MLSYTPYNSIKSVVNVKKYSDDDFIIIILK